LPATDLEDGRELHARQDAGEHVCALVYRDAPLAAAGGGECRDGPARGREPELLGDVRVLGEELVERVDVGRETGFGLGMISRHGLLRRRPQRQPSRPT
jgi:hypothetical protein